MMESQVRTLSLMASTVGQGEGLLAPVGGGQESSRSSPTRGWTIPSKAASAASPPR
jgi:hypothetical protein